MSGVLTGALPILAVEKDGLDISTVAEDESRASLDTPFGARIIQSVRRYDAMTNSSVGGLTPHEAIQTLKTDVSGEHHPAVLDALERVVLGSMDQIMQQVGLAPVQANA